MKSVVVLSGGMDSAVVLWQALALGREACCLTADYGQRHWKEIHAAAMLCESASQAFGRPVQHKVVDLRCMKPLMAGSSQTDASVPVPHGHYEEESMKRTVVPNRNMLLIAAAGAWAVSLKAQEIRFGAHAGDHAIYPDCRPAFVEAMDAALALCDWHRPFLQAPLLSLHKGEIAALGVSLGVPFRLTWTCYEGGGIPCGKCGSCQERKEAFAFAGAADPLAP